MIFAIGCINPGHFAGGGQLAFLDGNVPTSELAPFSLNINAIDVDKNGLIDEADRFNGHISIQPPKSFRKTGTRINGNVLFGGVCSTQSAENDLCNYNPVGPFTPFAAPTADVIKTHPKEGYAVMFGFYRTSGKNPDACATVAEDCVPFVSLVFDTDHNENFAPGDGVFFLDYGYNGFLALVAKGNLSITSETVNTAPQP